jgi:hypothetical protein
MNKGIRLPILELRSVEFPTCVTWFSRTDDRFFDRFASGETGSEGIAPVSSLVAQNTFTMPTQYTDFSAVSPKDEPHLQDHPSAHFPTQLHYILHELQKEGKDDIASWISHGRAFRVHPSQKGRFVDEVLQT